MCVSFFCSVCNFLTANRWNIFFMSTAKLKKIQPLKLVIPFPLRSIPFQITKCLIRNPKKAFFSSLPPRCNTLSHHFLMIAGWIATCWNIFWRSLSKLLCKNSKTFVAWSLLCQHQNVITITSLRSQEKLLWEIMTKYAIQGLVHTHRVIFKNTFFGGLSSGLASVLTNRGTEFTQICQMQRAMHTHTHTWKKFQLPLAMDVLFLFPGHCLQSDKQLEMREWRWNWETALHSSACDGRE